MDVQSNSPHERTTQGGVWVKELTSQVSLEKGVAGTFAAGSRMSKPREVTREARHLRAPKRLDSTNTEAIQVT